MSTSTARQTFRQLVAAIADKARQTLPDANGRVDKAVALVLQGDVELLPDGTARVFRQSNGVTSYHVVNGHCDCHDFERAPSQWCKHRIAAGLQTRVAARLPQADDQPPEDQPPDAPAPVPVVATSGSRTIPAQYLQQIQGKPFIKYAGLLQMAHDRGLQALRATWTFNDGELSLAHAVATFAFGTFEESGDSTPQNAQRVGLHWRRLSLTRAKARCLRDALGIDLCAVEEME